ncbi:MAG: GDP-mannose 4,6-dehydratase [Gemmatimonadetes bacterium]|nr:GDP-mannose 4,6-dehydratase [Gemmatimonadota bacterium]
MTLTGERVLVTGAAGFIGSHLVECLLSRGAVVIGVDNFDPFYPAAEKRANLARAAKHPTFRLVEADCADLPALDTALSGESLQAVVHLAAKAGVRPSILDPLGYTRANVVATQAILELARRRGIRRVVFGSSSSVYGNSPMVPFSEDQPADRPVSPYAATKRAAELLCATYHELYHVGILALRFFTVYGPRQRPDLAIRKFGSLMLRGEPVPFYGDGSTERDYTWIDDIVDGVVAALERTRAVPGEFEIINLGGHRTTSLARLVVLLGAALNVEPRLQRLPLQPGDVVRTYADVTKAGRLLGYAPRMPIEDGIQRFAAWLRERERERSAAPGGRAPVELVS